MSGHDPYAGIGAVDPYHGIGVPAESHGPGQAFSEAWQGIKGVAHQASQDFHTAYFSPDSAYGPPGNTQPSAPVEAVDRLTQVPGAMFDAATTGFMHGLAGIEPDTTRVLTIAGSLAAPGLAGAARMGEGDAALASVPKSLGPPRTSAASAATVPPLPSKALTVFAKKAKPSVPAMKARAAQYRAVGIDPTLADVTDESGRAVIRAAATKMTPGRQVAQDFGDARALDLPDRIGGQVRTVMSSDPRTPDEIAGEIAAQRKAEADQQYGAVRNEQFAMPEQTVAALRTDYGREAIAEAAKRERDLDTKAALNRLAADSLDDPSTPISVGMADSLSKVLYGKARSASTSGDNSLSSFLSGLGDDVRNPAIEAHPGYGDAVANYAAHSRLINAGGQGEEFLRRNTDEFNAAVGGMSPEETLIARATGRRAVERAAGESVGAAPGVANRIAFAPEQQSRNAALLGPDAQRLQAGMGLETQAVRNAQDIAPRTGSQTASKVQDALAVGTDVARIAGKGFRGDVVGGALDAAQMWLKRRGLDDVSAEELVRRATDPTQTDALLAAMEAKLGRSGAKLFMAQFGPRLRGAAPLAIGYAGTALPRLPPPSTPGP